MKIGIGIGIGIVIGVVMTVILIIGLVVGGFFGLVFLVDRGYEKGRQKKAQAEFDGREFGKTTDHNGCMEKGFLTKEYLVSGFVRECLKSSKPIPDFCDGAPLGYNSGKGKDISKWLDERCKKVGHNGRSCIDTFNAKRGFCTESNGNESK